MSGNSTGGLEARFLDSGKGRLFTLYFPPVGPARGSWLFVPPFAEELNRCRSTVATTARAMSHAGYAVMLLDLSGTGESDGDFTHATVDQWLTDIHVAADALHELTNLPTSLWGMRLGATLAAFAANQRPDEYHDLLLWQPVHNGKTFTTQYLRLRVAALMARNQPAEDTKAIRAALAAGEVVEVAGYLLSGTLVDGIEQLDMTNLPALEKQHIRWIEHVLDKGKPLGIASQKIVSTLAAQGCTIETAGFSGATVWQAHEIVQSPDLVETTLSLLGIP